MEYMRLNLGLSSEILNGIKVVEYAQNIEAEKKGHFLCGINLEYTKESGLRLITTDGKRMAVAQLPHRNENGDISIIIPTEELGILKEYLADKNSEVNIEQIDENMAAFYIGDTKKLIKLIPKKYPDYRAVIFYPIGYDESVTVERMLAISFMEKIIGTSEGYDPSDWVQWDNTIYVTKASDLLNTKEITKRSMETFRQILHFIVKDNPKVVEYADTLVNNIFNYLPQEEYQKQLDEIEKRNLPPVEFIGTLNILKSQSESKFSGRFNSNFILDALKTMIGDNITLSYKMEGHFTTLHPILLKDDTENIHVIMPMKVD
jgi:DNA polymerase III sliding clamp (beta) subunit (PCNA family)